MENIDKYKNLEKILRSARTSDVELPSHKTNLRRALMSKHQTAANLNNNYSPMKFTLDLSKFAFTVVALVAFVVGGIAIYEGVNPKPIITTTPKSIQSALQEITDNFALNEITDNYSFVLITDNVSADIPSFYEYSDKKGGFSLDIPAIVNQTGTSFAGESENPDYSTAIFTYYSEDGNEENTIVIEVIRNFDSFLTEGYSQYANKTEETIIVNDIALEVYDTSFPSTYEQGSHFYAFTGQDGISYALYLRAYKSLITEDPQNNYYTGIIENVLNSLKWIE